MFFYKILSLNNLEVDLITSQGPDNLNSPTTVLDIFAAKTLLGFINGENFGEKVNNYYKKRVTLSDNEINNINQKIESLSKVFRILTESSISVTKKSRIFLLCLKHKKIDPDMIKTCFKNVVNEKRAGSEIHKKILSWIESDFQDGAFFCKTNIRIVKQILKILFLYQHYPT